MPVLSSLPVLLPSFFFSLRSFVHRDLLSFPTRRSSDLARRCRALDQSTHATHSSDSPRGVRQSPSCTGRQDRKSTRLNSSHVAISYAVFCLKKERSIETGNHEVQDTEK